ncbi:hypothetical protein WICPIJ_009223 [Wickerhamomyces pijperi]|uniref:Uncharacterized protein n=1 Tax=Wickerhamomyces pijperi TaxID=599730 RepID=A0A9P8TEZ0_WICPI|nr:hypothetical protein WICPIJ_009223 [Wickerhamomyces pijperi]
MSTSTNQMPPDLEKGIYQTSNPNGSSTEFDPQSLTQTQQKSSDSGVADNTVLRKITTSTDGDTIYLGDQAFSRKELQNAFAGDLRPGLYTAPTRPMGNPVPLGLTGFCICCFVVSVINTGARGVNNQQVIASASLFLGGAIETIAGLWCLLVENTFGATALGAFGGFWMGYWALLCDAWGVRTSYATTQEYNDAVGFYLSVWVIFAFLMWLCTFRSTWPFFVLFFLVWFFLMLLAIGSFTGHAGVTKAGGVFGLLASFNGFYIVYAGTADPTNSLLVPKTLPMPWAQVV